MKPKIIHLIYDLGRGGAENILVQTLPALTDFENYIVTFSKKNDFEHELQGQHVISLDTPHIWHLPLAVIKLRKLIGKLKPSLVHSQLTNPNIVSRLATPKRIPLITSIQNSVKYNVEFKKWYIRLMEKRSLSFRPSMVIFVAKSVKDDYVHFLKVQPREFSILYNFVDTKKFIHNTSPKKNNDVFRIISVGSLSYQKHFEFLLSAFMKAGIPNTELHIFGDGPLRPKLEQLIIGSGDCIKLMGNVSRIAKILPTYDLYASSSRYEGLSLSVLEAMATGIPLLLTNIPSFCEQCEDGALYYEEGDETEFIARLKWAVAHPGVLQTNAEKCMDKVKQIYNFDVYIHQLKTLYTHSINSTPVQQ